MLPEEQLCTLDELLNELGHIQRRKLLRALMKRNPQDDVPVYLDEGESTDEDLSRLIQMHHVHLPKLERYGFIRWDRDKNVVSKGPNFDEIEPLLELFSKHEDELPDEWI